MKICVAQTRPVKGHIPANIQRHKKLTELAISEGTDLIIFPELSLTGYEPTLAEKLATDQEDSRFNVFQELSNNGQVTIGVGVPVKSPVGICIGMVLFQPHRNRQTYFKQYLHPDEEEFFVAGEGLTGLTVQKNYVALAICYELSVPEHSERASNNGAKIYIASVAKSGEGADHATKTLSEIARKYSMTVLMSNCTGPCEGFEAEGRTSVWNTKGVLAAQLGNNTEGMIIIDTCTGGIIEKTI